MSKIARKCQLSGRKCQFIIKMSVEMSVEFNKQKGDVAYV